MYHFYVDSKYCLIYCHCMMNEWKSLDTDLEGLEAATASVLARLAVSVGDERVRDVPNARVLRYYGTLGLLDRPLRYDGRKARYGFRHLLQVVAVKVLQSEGLPLSQIQELLAGRSTEELARSIEGAVPYQPPHPYVQVAAEPNVHVFAYQPAVGPKHWVRLLRADLAPGVQVTVDPSIVADPESLLAALAAAISPRGEP